MYTQLNQDRDNLSSILDITKKQSLDFLSQLPNRSTVTNISTIEASVLPEEGLGTLATLNMFNDNIEKLMVASAGPRYLGFVTGGTTPAALVGDWLVSIYDQNTQSVRGNGDVSAQIELNTIKLILELLNLPHVYMGGFVTGATMSNFTCLAVARQWLGKQLSQNVALHGVTQSYKIIAATPHSSSIKCLSMLGIGSSNILMLDTISEDRESIDVQLLEEQLIALNGEPALLISSGGTVNTVDFDDMHAISLLKRKYNFWWHIDAAFGAFAACTSEYAYLLKGWELADSITIDCHKWLNVPYDSGVFLIREEHRYLQVETFQNSNAPYLGDPLENFSYLNFLPENSRRMRALPAWFTLMAYGKMGYQEIVLRSIANARLLGQKIQSTEDFILLAPVRLNTVCFTLANNDDPSKLQQFLHRLTASGKVFMTPTVYKGKMCIRAAFVNWRTTEKDVALIFDTMKSLIVK
ncbi:pyridoxal-dependent decarboxylase [Sediminibacterium sp. KACHI17]